MKKLEIQIPEGKVIDKGCKCRYYNLEKILYLYMNPNKCPKCKKALTLNS